MATGDKPIVIFYTLLLVFFLLNIFMPYVNDLFNINDSQNTGNVYSMFEDSTYLTIGLSLVTIPFWTFGLPAIFNAILIIPRIIMLISLYYVIFPTK